jgi:hypothetical protein
MVDIFGFSMGLWQHNIRLLPIVPGVFPIDFTVVPILLMLAHQYGSTWSKYLTWSALTSLLFGFVISPAFQFFDIKAYFNWHFGYFVILMMIVAMISRIVIEFVEKTVKIHSSSFPVATQSMLMPQPAAKKYLILKRIAETLMIIRLLWTPRNVGRIEVNEGEACFSVDLQGRFLWGYGVGSQLYSIQRAWTL